MIKFFLTTGDPPYISIPTSQPEMILSEMTALLLPVLHVIPAKLLVTEQFEIIGAAPEIQIARCPPVFITVHLFIFGETLSM